MERTFAIAPLHDVAMRQKLERALLQVPGVRTAIVDGAGGTVVVGGLAGERRLLRAFVECGVSAVAGTAELLHSVRRGRSH
ncbi:MAG: cation transporter [Acidimicrobiales bacterium]